MACPRAYAWSAPDPRAPGSEAAGEPSRESSRPGRADHRNDPGMFVLFLGLPDVGTGALGIRKEGIGERVQHRGSNSGPHQHAEEELTLVLFHGVAGARSSERAHRGPHQGTPHARSHPGLSPQEVADAHNTQAGSEGCAETCPHEDEAVEARGRLLEFLVTHHKPANEGRKGGQKTRRSARQQARWWLEDEPSGEAEPTPRLLLRFTRKDLPARSQLRGRFLRGNEGRCLVFLGEASARHEQEEAQHRTREKRRRAFQEHGPE